MWAGLAGGLLSKEDVLDWAEEIVMKEQQPDIFFIDLVLLGTKNANELIHYFCDYLNFEKPVVQGRPLLGMLYAKYASGRMGIEQVVRKLFALRWEAVFNTLEEGCIYSLDYQYDLFTEGVMGTLQNVQSDLGAFLSLYKDYSFKNIENCEALDKYIDESLEAYCKERQW